jgi:hypothetical protein
MLTGHVKEDQLHSYHEGRSIAANSMVIQLRIQR